MYRSAGVYSFPSQIFLFTSRSRFANIRDFMRKGKGDFVPCAFYIGYSASCIQNWQNAGTFQAQIDHKTASSCTHLISTALQLCIRGLPMSICPYVRLSVRPSVRPSVCVSNASIVTKRKLLSIFLHCNIRSMHLVSRHGEWLVRRPLSIWNFGDKLAHPLHKRRLQIDSRS